MISAAAAAFPETTTLISPLGGATRLNNSRGPFPPGCKPEDNFTQGTFSSTSIMIPSTAASRRAPPFTSTSPKRSICAKPLSVFLLRFHNPSVRFCYAIILVSFFDGCATKKEVRPPFLGCWRHSTNEVTFSRCTCSARLIRRSSKNREIACQDSRYFVSVSDEFEYRTRNHPGTQTIMSCVSPSRETVVAAFASSSVLYARISRALLVSLPTPRRNPSDFL